MKFLMNGTFYQFLTLFCTIAFEHDPGIFDWIPVHVRIQLIKLLDEWKATQLRAPHYQGILADFSIDENERAYREIAERKILFKFALKKAYQDAERLAKENSSHGIQEAPVPDLDFWRRVCNRELYEARLAAGEPVVFYQGRSCLYGSLAEYAHKVVPGPYPGLQYYHFYDNDGIHLSCEEEFWHMAQEARNSGEKMQKKPLPMGYGAIPCHIKRELLWELFSVIGPATYAEFVNQHGLDDAILFTDEHTPFQDGYLRKFTNLTDLDDMEVPWDGTAACMEEEMEKEKELSKKSEELPSFIQGPVFIQPC